jgi:hypothetical protein
VRYRLLTVACVASVLAFGLAATTAGAEVGPMLPGDISTFAGSPVFGPVGATSLGVNGNPATATLDGTTYAYFADGTQHVIRRVNLATGTAQVVAGNGGLGTPVDGVPATSTSLGQSSEDAAPQAVAVDAAGDMAIITSVNEGGVQFVPASSGSYFGQTMTAGDIYTLEQLSNSYRIPAQAIAFDPQGDLVYAKDTGLSVLSVTTGDSVPVNVGSFPDSDMTNAVAVDAQGDIAYLGGGGDQVDFVPKTAGTYFGQYESGAFALVDPNDVGTGTCCMHPSPLGDNEPSRSATTTGPTGLTFDPAGDLILSDPGNHEMRIVTAHSCSSACPFALTPASEGYIYKIPGVDPAVPSADSNGDLVTADDQFVSSSTAAVTTIIGNGTAGYSGNGEPGAQAELADASWVASDARGDVAIVDDFDSRIRFIPASSGTFYEQAMTAGDIYTIAGNGGALTSTGGGGDGGLATAPGATFSTFEVGSGIALDAGGDLIVTDPGFGTTKEVRFVPARSGTFYGQSMTAGYVYTIAGPSGLADPNDVAVDAAGDVLVADGEVRKITAGTGALTTVAGSSGLSAYGIAVDAHHDLAVTNRFGNTVSFIPATGGTFFGQTMNAATAYIIAGNGTAGYTGDGAAATSAEVDGPEGLTFDATGDLAIAQFGSGSLFPPDFAIRFLPETSGSFYGQAMTAGDIYSLAGAPPGIQGSLGDDGLATSAELAEPTSVAMGLGEDVLVADSYNNRIRRIVGSVPTATTETAGTATESSDTVNGSVNPQGRPIGYSFEYGTTTAYGSSTPEIAVGSDHTGHPGSQTLTGLEPGTTYHYRILADYDEAGATISTPGADASFTTTGKKPEGSPPEENKSPSVGGSTTSGISTITTSSSTGSTSGGGTSVSVATSPKAVEELLHGCSSSPLVLNDVYIQGSHVFLSGSAAKSLAGKKVKILFNEGKSVATATVEANGLYTTTAPLPPAKIRDNLNTRYTAEIGKARSLHLKLVRRLLLEPPRPSGTTVTLTGQLTLPLTKPIAPVVVEQQLECGKTTIAKTFTPAANGHFHITITVPANARAGIFRLTSKVAANNHSIAHGFTTFSLPLPVSIGSGG